MESFTNDLINRDMRAAFFPEVQDSGDLVESTTAKRLFGGLAFRDSFLATFRRTMNIAAQVGRFPSAARMAQQRARHLGLVCLHA
jgi:hypothetical protein